MIVSPPSSVTRPQKRLVTLDSKKRSAASKQLHACRLLGIDVHSASTAPSKPRLQIGGYDNVGEFFQNSASNRRNFCPLSRAFCNQTGERTFHAHFDLCQSFSPANKSPRGNLFQAQDPHHLATKKRN